MLEQFQKVLQTPKTTELNYYKLIQDSMLNTMESIMPHDFDFGELAKLFDKQTENQNSASLTYKLTEFFVKVVTQNFISLQSYYALEHQTQKAENTVRGHIKYHLDNINNQMQQQMKMYLQHLEYKIERYEYHLNKLRKQYGRGVQEQGRDSKEKERQFRQKESVEELRRRETQLLKERIVLLRKVDQLERRVKDQENELQRLNSPTSATIFHFKQEFSRSRQVVLHQKPLQLPNLIQNPKSTSYQISRRMSTHSFTSDQQVTQKKCSNTYHPAQLYRLYSSADKHQLQMENTPLPIEMTQTIKQIQFVESKNVIVVENNSSNSPIKNLIGVE